MAKTDLIAYLRALRAPDGALALPEPVEIFGQTFTRLPEISIQHKLRLLNIHEEPDPEQLYRELFTRTFGAGAYDRMLDAGMSESDRFDLVLWIMRGYALPDASADPNAETPAA